MIMSAMSHSLTHVLVILTIIHKSYQEINLVAAWWFTSTNGGTDLSTYAENNVNIDPLTYRIGPNGETDGSVEFRDIDIDGFLGGGRFDVASITDKLVFTASMTFFCHVYIPSGSDKDTVVFAYKGSSLPALLVDLDTGSVQVENFGIDPSTGNPYIDLTDLLTTKLGQWLQLAVVYDTTYGVKIYESGILLSQTPCNVDLSSLRTGTPLIFGGKDEITQTMEGGALACAQFYNTSLTQAEVQALTCDIANVAPAPVDGDWGDWTKWTLCSVTCDNGTQTRNRECNNPEPENGGDNCTGSYEEYVECFIADCSMVRELEPVGAWWFTEENDENDVSIFRENPSNITGLSYVEGPYGNPKGAVTAPKTDSQNLAVYPKTDRLYFDPDDNMTVFCNIYPESGSGLVFEYNDCGDPPTPTPTPPPLPPNVHDTGRGLSLLIDENGSDQTCFDLTLERINSSDDFSINMPCTVNATMWNKIVLVAGAGHVSVYVNGVAVFDEDTVVTLRTDKGKHIHFGHRLYSSVSFNLNARFACAQIYDTLLTPAQVEDLYCDPDKVPVHGDWGNWTDWTPCSVTCDNGTQTRNRECNNPAPENGGDNCTGSYVEIIECFEEYCPVHGGWGNWTDWTPCSVTCDNGTQSRNRECNNPEPEYGGDNCTGSYEDVIECLEEYCPGKTKHMFNYFLITPTLRK